MTVCAWPPKPTHIARRVPQAARASSARGRRQRASNSLCIPCSYRIALRAPATLYLLRRSGARSSFLALARLPRTKTKRQNFAQKHLQHQCNLLPSLSGALSPQTTHPHSILPLLLLYAPLRISPPARHTSLHAGILHALGWVSFCIWFVVGTFGTLA